MRRWGAAAFAILVAHAALVVLGTHWYRPLSPPGATLPAIMVDMAPATSAPQSSPQDVAPGPEMQQADASPPEPVAPPMMEAQEVPPTPLQKAPDVVAPPEQKVEPAKLEPAPPVPDQKPAPVKPRVVRPDAKKPSEAPAPRTTAPPRVERQAPLASAVSSGSSATAIASYNQIIRAHLLRFKQFPSAAKAAGQQGVARLSFTLGRGGNVLASRLAGSSGYAALDAETLAMVRRAQPFPAFPPEMKQGSMGFSIGVDFFLR